MKPGKQRANAGWARLEAALGDLSEAELARRIAAGDTAAFELLMRRNNQTLFRTARSILKDDAEAEDAVQEAYLRAYQAIDGFRAEARLQTWLVRITVNQALERARRRAPERGAVPIENVVNLEERMDAANPHPGADAPEKGAMRSELRRILERKIDELPDAFRTVFVLRSLEELSVEETAASLGIPEATVRTRYFRARSLLRESLAREVDLATEDAFAFAGERCDRIVAAVLKRFVALPATAPAAGEPNP